MQGSMIASCTVSDTPEFFLQTTDNIVEIREKVVTPGFFGYQLRLGDIAVDPKFLKVFATTHDLKNVVKIELITDPNGKIWIDVLLDGSGSVSFGVYSSLHG